MPIPTAMRVLLFTDMVDSTAWKKTLGDRAYATDLLHPHDHLFRELLTEYPGASEQNNTGDGFLAVFPTPGEAVNFALRFHLGLANHPWSNAVTSSNQMPTTRIGIHVGEVVEFDDLSMKKVSGQAVDLAARVMGLGLGGQTLLTRHAFDSARQYVRKNPAGGGALAWVAHGHYRFKGNEDDPMEIFGVGTDGTASLAPPPDSEKAKRVRVDAANDTGAWRPAVGLDIPRRDGWILEHPIGEGGFGEVWIAKHKKTKETRVFKFCFDAERLRSFKRELTLFRLLQSEFGERKDFVRLYDVQVDLAPYFLESEFIQEGNLSEWVAKKEFANWPIADRLRFVAEAGRTVASAHTLGIIHKDLKPSNILVRMENGLPKPVIADFGIGVLTDQEILANRDITFTGGLTTILGNDSSRTGTRLYSPPETLLGKPASTGHDVFALGVILFQLRLGDFAEPMGTGWEEKITGAGRDTLLKEDIRAATLTDPSKRLATANAFAERLEKLEARTHERELEVRVATQAKRMRLLKRALALAVAVMVMVGGVAWYAWQQRGIAVALAKRAEELKKVAEEEAARATEVTQVITRMFRATDPMNFAGGEQQPGLWAKEKEMSVRELLDRESAKIDKIPSVHLRTELLNVIGTCYVNLGEILKARPLLEESLRLRNSENAVNAGSVSTELFIGEAYLQMADYTEARRHFERSLEIQRSLKAHEEDIARCQLYLAYAQALSKDPNWERSIREVIAIRERIYGPNDARTVHAKIGLLSFLLDDVNPQKRQAEILEFWTALQESIRASPNGQLKSILECAQNFQSAIMILQGIKWLPIILRNKALEEAEQKFRRTLEVGVKCFPPNHYFICLVRGDLAHCLARQGKTDAALNEHRKLFQDLCDSLLVAHPKSFQGIQSYLSLLHKKNLKAEEFAVVDRLDSIFREKLNDGCQGTIRLKASRARVYYLYRETSIGSKEMEEVLSRLKKGQFIPSVELVEDIIRLGEAMRDEHIEAKILELLAENHSLIKKMFAEPSEAEYANQRTVTRCFFDLKDYEKAEKALDAAASLRDAVGLKDPFDFYWIEDYRGRLGAVRGNYRLAAKHYQDAYNYRAKAEDMDYDSDLLAEDLAGSYCEIGQYAKAAEVLEKSIALLSKKTDRKGNVARKLAMLASVQIAEKNKEGLAKSHASLLKLAEDPSVLNAQAGLAFLEAIQPSNPKNWRPADCCRVILSKGNPGPEQKRALAIAQILDGKLDAAQETIQSFSAEKRLLDPLLLAWVYAAKGNSPEARKALQAAEELRMSGVPSAERPFAADKFSWWDRFISKRVMERLTAELKP